MKPSGLVGFADKSLRLRAKHAGRAFHALGYRAESKMNA